MAAIIVAATFEDGRRWVWTVAIAALPLLWVLGGFHLWRRICPLSFFSQIPRLMGRGGDRKVTGWWAGHALEVQLGVMVAALALRLLWINGSQMGLAGFLGGVALLAMGTGFVLRGKNWCNFLCPVGMVEKLYTEPSRLAGTENSQCPSCSACKAQCPDIDFEHSYWKGSGDRGHRIAYFAWPGIVFGFYFHYFLQAGTWDWYFSGDWTRESDAVGQLLSAGFFFAPAIPRAAAAPLTLLLSGAVSYGPFAVGHAAAERRAQGSAEGLPAGVEARIRHRAYALAGYVGFNLFYAFAGQPTLRAFPDGARWGVATAVVALSTMIFLRRWLRDESSFVQDKLAKKLARRWKWDDEAGDKTSTELVVLHTERVRHRKERLESYRDSVAELAREGILTEAHLNALGTVRASLGITDREHDKVVAELASTGTDLFGGAGSPEAALQRQQYRAELERIVRYATDSGGALDVAAVARLQKTFGVSEAEHQELLAALLNPGGELNDRLVEHARRLVVLGATAAHADGADEDERLFVGWICAWAGHGPAEALSTALRSAGEGGDEVNALTDPDPKRRGTAAAALLAGTLGAGEVEAEPAGLDDPERWVSRSIALLAGNPEAFVSYMVALHQVDLFAGLAPPDLGRLGDLAQTRSFGADEALCTQGDAGDEDLIILSGTPRCWSPARR
ncbi:MAG: hypothetical protein GY898_08320 [Proteobacteria bacterium]|nr:hypothetical protein [Pseudomonadota bacterium]